MMVLSSLPEFADALFSRPLSEKEFADAWELLERSGNLILQANGAGEIAKKTGDGERYAEYLIFMGFHLGKKFAEAQHFQGVKNSALN